MIPWILVGIGSLLAGAFGLYQCGHDDALNDIDWDQKYQNEINGNGFLDE